jgi:hypothetical protein
MPKMYQVSVRWVKSSMEPARVDSVLGNHGDWLRFHSMLWLVWSNSNATVITGSVKSVLLPEDSILVMAVDLYDMGGWAQPWVWDWITSKREEASRQGGLLSGLADPRRGGLLGDLK